MSTWKFYFSLQKYQLENEIGELASEATPTNLMKNKFYTWTKTNFTPEQRQCSTWGFSQSKMKPEVKKQKLCCCVMFIIAAFLCPTKWVQETLHNWSISYDQWSISTQSWQTSEHSNLVSVRWPMGVFKRSASFTSRSVLWYPPCPVVCWQQAVMFSHMKIQKIVWCSELVIWKSPKFAPLLCWGLLPLEIQIWATWKWSLDVWSLLG